MSVLDEILAAKRDEVTMLHQPETRDALRRAALDAPPARDFAGASARVARRPARRDRRDQAAVAVEGRPRARPRPARRRRRRTRRGGAACLSVLTDRPFFGGSVDDLQAARAAVELPVLRKDFTIDEIQVYETRAIGADAVLLDRRRAPATTGCSRDLHELADELGLARWSRRTTTPSSTGRSPPAPRVVGVNARDLGTFDEDLGARASGSPARIPADVIAVAESAIRSPDDAERMAEAGFDAVLVGEALVRSRRSAPRSCERDEPRIRSQPRRNLVTAIRPVRRADARPRGSTCCPVLPEPLQPPLHPATREPVGPDDLAPLFPMGLIAQEVSTDPWIDIPGEVLDILRLWRPTPLVRAERLEAALGTPARIYFKDESVSPAGSHKPNTAVPQAFYNQAEGVPRLTTETGAGQWGTALAFACAQFDLECKVYMVRGVVRAEAVPQDPHGDVGERGRAVTGRRPDHPGSLGLAISDAVRDAAARDDTHYSLGSVLNHVLLHQTIIGLEAKEQLALAGEARPDVVHRLLRRRLEPRRHRAAVRARRRACGSSRWSRRRARRSPRARSTTTSATPRA